MNFTKIFVIILAISIELSSLFGRSAPMRKHHIKMYGSEMLNDAINNTIFQ